MNHPLRCPRCGSGNAAGQRFCTNCGQALNPPAAETPKKAGPASPVQPPIQQQNSPAPQLPPSASGLIARILQVVNRIFNLAMRWIPRLPLYGRLAPFLGVDELTTINPIIKLGTLGLVGLLGLYPSLYGHIDTTPFLYPIMALISSFNPALGMISGVIFGIGDLAEKLVTNQVYYSGSSNIVDYLGARLGYILAYSAVIVAGMLPGLMSRAFRLAARRMFSGRVGPPPGTLGFIAFTADSRTLELAAGVVGGLLGGGLSSALAIPLEIPAFMLRANPDISCYSAAVGNLTRGIGPTAVAGGAGGAISSMTGWGGGGGGPAAPSSPAAAPPMVTDQKVVSGEEAIQRLTDAGLHDGDCVPVPDHWPSTPSNIRGVGYTKTRPHPTDPNKRCLDPSGTAIAVDWPHPAGPTTTTVLKPGPDLIDRIRDIGFTTHTVSTDDGTFVVSPENLPDNVAGIGHGSDTITDPTTGEDVVIITNDTEVIIEHWPKQPKPPDPITILPPDTTPGPEPEPVGPREPEKEPEPPPPPPPEPPPEPPPTPPPTPPLQPQQPPQQPQRKKMKTFRIRMVSGGDGGAGIGGGVLTVEIQEMPNGRFGRRRYFTFAGAGLTAGGAAGATGPSGWVNFTSLQATCLEDFEGPGAVGVGPGASLVYGISAGSMLFFASAPARVNMPWGGGWGVGATIASFYMGWWEMR